MTIVEEVTQPQEKPPVQVTPGSDELTPKEQKIFNRFLEKGEVSVAQVHPPGISHALCLDSIRRLLGRLTAGIEASFVTTTHHQ